jgi:hypothetical protein
MKKAEIGYFGSVVWANDQLRFSISQLREAAEKGDFQWKTTMHLVLFLMDRLQELGYTWQRKILDHWIHKYQGRRRSVAP